MKPRHLALLPLLLLLGVLQHRLWSDGGTLDRLTEMELRLESQRAENAEQVRNIEALAAEVIDLKQGLEAIEERARTDLGMIRAGERFYLLVEPDERRGGEAG